METEQKFKKEDLQKLIFDEKISYREIGRIYDVSDTYIKKIAKKLGIVLEKRKIFPNDFVPYNKGTRLEKTCKYCGNIIPENTPKRQKYCCFECSTKDRPKFNYENLPSIGEKIKGLIFFRNRLIEIHAYNDFIQKFSVTDLAASLDLNSVTS